MTDAKVEPRPLAEEVADAHRHATEPQAALGGDSPVDRILRVLATARAACQRPGQGFATLPGGPLADLADALEALDLVLANEAREADQPEAGHWHPTTWAEVKGGDRVRVAQQHEATVETVVPLTWLGSGATQVQVTLQGREHPYQMPPSGPVEVWTPSPPEWAAQAYLTMVESGVYRG